MRSNVVGNIPFLQIRDKYPFNETILANLAEVNPVVIRWMLTGQPVAKWQAEEVLRVLSMITEEDYSLDTVEVVLNQMEKR